MENMTRVLKSLPAEAKDQWRIGKAREIHFAISLIDKNGSMVYMSKTSKFLTEKTCIGTITLLDTYKTRSSVAGLDNTVGDFLIKFNNSEMAKYANDVLTIYERDGIAKINNRYDILSLAVERKYGKPITRCTLICHFASLLESEITEDYYSILFADKYDSLFIKSALEKEEKNGK